MTDVGFYTDNFKIEVLDNDVVPWLHQKCFEFIQALETEDSVPTALAKDHLKSEEEIHTKIKSLQNIGMEYRKIANHLNQLEIKTIKGNKWNNTNVYSVLKKYKERQQRLKKRDKDYKIIWSRMEVKWELNPKN